MAAISQILAGKENKIVSIDQDATVLDAAVLLNKSKVGALVAMDEDRIVGIFTERDVLRRVVGERRDPATTMVRQVMTTEITCVLDSTDHEEAQALMINQHIRHLPIVDEARQFKGIISMRDLAAFDADAKEVQIHYLEEYLYGRA